MLIVYDPNNNRPRLNMPRAVNPIILGPKISLNVGEFGPGYNEVSTADFEKYVLNRPGVKDQIQSRVDKKQIWLIVNGKESRAKLESWIKLAEDDVGLAGMGDDEAKLIIEDTVNLDQLKSWKDSGLLSENKVSSINNRLNKLLQSGKEDDK